MTRKAEIERVYECIKFLLQDSPRAVVKLIPGNKIIVTIGEES